MLKSYKIENEFVLAFSCSDSIIHEIKSTGNEPFLHNPETAFNYQLVDGQWQERTWSELQIVSVTYDWQRSVCIVSISNGDTCEFPCVEEWNTQDVVDALHAVQRYQLTNFQ